MVRQKYRVLTWDADKQRFTPQFGVRQGPYTLFGLRKVIRLLRSMGYGCERWSLSVRVEQYPVPDLTSTPEALDG
jgi:hypothetical protein